MQILIVHDEKKNKAKIAEHKKAFKSTARELFRELYGYYNTETETGGMTMMERRNLDKEIEGQLDYYIEMLEQVAKMSPEEYDKYLMGQYTDMQKVIQDSYGVDMPSMDELNKMSDDELMDYFDAKGINLDDVMGGF